MLIDNLMRNPMFPTDIFIGLVFNDFIEKSPSLLHTYAPYAVRFQRQDDMCILWMEDDSCESICVDQYDGDTPQWISYDVDREMTIKKLNRFIFSNLTCTADTSAYCLFSHPAGVTVCVLKGGGGVYTYMLAWL